MAKLIVTEIDAAAIGETLSASVYVTTTNGEVASGVVVTLKFAGPTGGQYVEAISDSNGIATANVGYFLFTKGAYDVKVCNVVRIGDTWNHRESVTTRRITR